MDAAKFVLGKEKVFCVDWTSHINDIIVNSWLFTSQMENKPGKAKQEMRNYYRKPWKKLALPASWECAMNNLSGGYTWPPMTPILPRVIAPVVPGTCPWKPVQKLWKLGQGIHEQAASGVIVTSANPWISSFAQWSIWGNVLDGSSNTMRFFF